MPLELRADGRVLLALPTSARRPERARELTARTVGHVDGALPGDAEPVTSGDGDAPAARETAVLFVLRGMGDQVLLLDALAAHEPYLADWAQGAKRQVGFVLERPLVGAYLETAPGLEEWRPENEHVHRLAELLVLRRFGRLPWWLQQGIAWEVEMELEGGVYCFPYRSEFVWATEHGAWPSEVRRMYGGRPTPALDLELLTDWNRGSFEQEAAVTAWGAANYLLAKHPEAFPAFLNDLRAFRDEADRVDDGDDTWHRDVGYEIPREEVERMLESRFGADVLADAGAYLGAGRAR